MSFKEEVDAEAKKMIEKGIPPMEALKQAVQIVTERLSAEMEPPAVMNPGKVPID